MVDLVEVDVRPPGSLPEALGMARTPATVRGGWLTPASFGRRTVAYALPLSFGRRRRHGAPQVPLLRNLLPSRDGQKATLWCQPPDGPPMWVSAWWFEAGTTSCSSHKAPGRRIGSRVQGPSSLSRERPSVGLDAESTRSNQGMHPTCTMWLHVRPVMLLLSTELAPRTNEDNAPELSTK